MAALAKNPTRLQTSGFSTVTNTHVSVWAAGCRGGQSQRFVTEEAPTGPFATHGIARGLKATATCGICCIPVAGIFSFQPSSQLDRLSRKRWAVDLFSGARTRSICSVQGEIRAR